MRKDWPADAKVCEHGEAPKVCRICELERRLDLLAKDCITGFYEDEVPTFTQGRPEHTLQSLVTAEEVTGYVDTIRQHRSRIVELEVALRFYADPLRYKGPNQLLSREEAAADPYSGIESPYRIDVTRDQGEIAKKALRE